LACAGYFDFLCRFYMASLRN